jgi:hypothetical protein
MRLYIANCTKHFAMLNYRVPEAGNPFAQSIEAGQQAMIGRPDMSLPQIEDIIRQLRIYGLFIVEEVGRIDKAYRIVWLASIDKAISSDKIRQALMHNESVLIDQGKVFREKAALALSRNMAERTPHAAQNIEMTVQEETPGSVGPTGAPGIAEGIYVSTDTSEARVKTARRKRSAKGG